MLSVEKKNKRKVGNLSPGISRKEKDGGKSQWSDGFRQRLEQISCEEEEKKTRRKKDREIRSQLSAENKTYLGKHGEQERRGRESVRNY